MVCWSSTLCTLSALCISWSYFAASIILNWCWPQKCDVPSIIIVWVQVWANSPRRLHIIGSRWCKSTTVTFTNRKRHRESLQCIKCFDLRNTGTWGWGFLGIKSSVAGGPLCRRKALCGLPTDGPSADRAKDWESWMLSLPRIGWSLETERLHEAAHGGLRRRGPKRQVH